MSFVRSGPRLLTLVPKDHKSFLRFLKDTFSVVEGTETLERFEDVISMAEHHQTVVCLSEGAHTADIRDLNPSQSVVLNMSAQAFLMALINSGGAEAVTHISRAPRLIIMKIIGDVDHAVERVAEDFKAGIEPTRDILGLYDSGTIIFFTQANINKNLNYSDFYPRAIYTADHFSEVINTLDHHALKYVNGGNGESKWAPCTIVIKDSREAYKLHCDRLMAVIDSLGMGMVLRDGWTETGGLLFGGDRVYEIVLYTYWEPMALKQILMALEFMENGERIATFDLYFGRKRIGPPESAKKSGDAPESVSARYRKMLYESLTEGERQRLIGIEDYIFATR